MKQHTLDPKAATFVAVAPVVSRAPSNKAATPRGRRSAESTGGDSREGQEVAATEEGLEGTSAKQVAWASEVRIEEVSKEVESADILEAPSSES